MDLPELNCDSEEANTRMNRQKISLDQNACKFVLTNDTDGCVLLLHYMYPFQNNVLSELWMPYGRRNAQRFFPTPTHSYIVWLT